MYVVSLFCLFDLLCFCIRLSFKGTLLTSILLSTIVGGDGVCCGYGNGEYQVYWDSVLVRSGGAFKSSDKVTFGACVDEVGWKDSYGDGCEWYERYDNPGCPNYGNYWANPTTGITPNQACCHCQL